MKKTVEADCRPTLRDLDAFIDGELDPSTASSVRAHVEACPACAQELDLRMRLRNRVRQAVAAQPPTPFLRTRVMARVAQEERSPKRFFRVRWAPAAAALAVTIAGGTLAYQLGPLRLAVASQDRYISSLLEKVSLGMRPGLADHVHCSVLRKYPKQAPFIAELEADLGPEYKELIRILRANVPGYYNLAIAHRCGYHGRRFIHVGFKSDSGLMSLVLARRQPGESLSANGIRPVLSQDGLELYGASAQRFQISGFESTHHFAYLISDEPASKNHQIMLAMGPQLAQVLAKLAG